MSLENLVKTNQLLRHEAEPAAIRRLLTAAERNLADARVDDISDETRFDAAYKAIMQCGLVGLHANGYRPGTSTPGHHQTIIQTLSQTLGVAREDWVVLDVLRRKRNVADYSGDLVEPEEVTECIARATAVLRTTCAWLKEHRPDLLA